MTALAALLAVTGLALNAVWEQLQCPHTRPTRETPR